MRVIQRSFNVTRKDVYTIIPIGDVHLGAAGCDEALLKSVIKRIKNTPNCYWIGMGDYCEFIGLSDRRFDPTTLADWIEVDDLVDLPRVQEERFLSFVRPIADRCLCLVEGNHERTIKQRSERDVFSNIVTGVKSAAGMKSEQKLGIGATGWLRLAFRRGRSTTSYTFSLHHGFVGGRLAGAKALNMQRWLWTHECDVALFGHSHNRMIQSESVHRVNSAGRLCEPVRTGAYTGTFLQSSIDGKTSYAEAAGYFPLPVGGVEIRLHPGSKSERNRLRVSM